MSVSLKRLKKVRCRVLDQSSGEPLGGVVVSLSVRPGDNGAAPAIPVATLCSDATGYLSFDLQELITAGLDMASGVLVSAPQAGVKDRDLLAPLMRPGGGGAGDGGRAVVRQALLVRGENPNVSDGGSLAIAFPVYVEKAHVRNGAACLSPELPAVQSPDKIDYELSPYSFVTPTRISLGDGDCCETLAPSTLPVQEHSFYKVVIHHERSTDDSDSVRVNVNSVDVTRPLEPQKSAWVKFAHVLEYQQRWYSLGHALGEIKYSLPLAPGESTQLAVLEWSRDDSASRYDSVRGTEYLDHDLRRDRAITDSIDAGLAEAQGGSSFLAGASSGMNYDTKLYGQYTGNWALGGGSSNSWGNRDILANTENDLHDHVAQATSFVRSLQSTVLVQATQAERDTVQTRRVANHNHCHALTIQYYEVLRHYRLETHYIGRRNAILIPFKPITHFTSALALQFQTLLEQALLDERLSSCFDALVRLAIGQSAYTDEPVPEASRGSENGKTEGKKEDHRFFSGESDKEFVVDSHAFVTSTALMIEKGSTVTITAKMGPDGEVKFGSGQFSGGGLGGLGDGSDTDSRWPGWSRTRPLPSGALCAEISGDKWVVGYGVTHVAEEEGELTLWFNDYSPGDNKGTAVIEKGKIIVRRPKPEPKHEVSQPKEQLAETGAFSKRTDRICAEMLLQHLNANLGHYNRAIWMLMDAAQRRMYLEEALGNNNELLYAIDDIPLTVSGHRVVFPFNGPMPKAEWFDEANPAPRMSIVTLPTRGLFAEAQLGHCNSCEVRDITRNSDWTEMTTEEPPAISGITPGPRGETPQLTPAQLPANVIQITQPPEAPAPTDVAAALGLLGTPNVFRNMSALNEASALLGKLADGTISSLAGIRQTAGEAKKKVDTARQAGDTSSANGSPPKTQQTPKDRYDNLQVAKRLADAAGELGLNDQQKAQLVEDIIGGGNDGGSGGAELQQAVALDKATEVATDIGTDIIKHIVNDFLQAKNLTMDLVKDGAVVLRGYTNVDDYIQSASGLPFESFTMYVQLENLGGGNALDGLYGTYEITWDDGYTLDPDKLKPADSAKKPYLNLIQCKQNIMITPENARVGQAIVDAKVKLDLIANKQPVPYRVAGFMFSYLQAEFGATLLISINLQSNFGGGASVSTIKIPIVREYGIARSTIKIVNNANHDGFDATYPPASQAINFGA